MSPPICRECFHWGRNPHGMDICLHDEYAGEINVVTGGRSYPLCVDMRDECGECGPFGRLYRNPPGWLAIIHSLLFWR